jgi:hypothetical protein
VGVEHGGEAAEKGKYDSTVFGALRRELPGALRMVQIARQWSCPTSASSQSGQNQEHNPDVACLRLHKVITGRSKRYSVTDQKNRPIKCLSLY